MSRMTGITGAENPAAGRTVQSVRGGGSSMPRTGEVSVSGSISAAGTVLDEYRKNGVDLCLSGVVPTESVSIYTEEEIEEMRKEKEEQAQKEMYQEQMEAAKEAAESMNEEFGKMAKAIEIARRLMHGDIVPNSDEKFLMDFDKDMYLGAKSMQALAQNKDAKEYDSILEEEEEEGSSVSADGDSVVIDATKLEIFQGNGESR